MYFLLCGANEIMYIIMYLQHCSGSFFMSAFFLQHFFGSLFFVTAVSFNISFLICLVVTEVARVRAAAVVETLCLAWQHLLLVTSSGIFKLQT